MKGKTSAALLYSTLHTIGYSTLSCIQEQGKYIDLKLQMSINNLSSHVGEVEAVKSPPSVCLFVSSLPQKGVMFGRTEGLRSQQESRT